MSFVYLTTQGKDRLAEIIEIDRRMGFSGEATAALVRAEFDVTEKPKVAKQLTRGEQVAEKYIYSPTGSTVWVRVESDREGIHVQPDGRVDECVQRVRKGFASAIDAELESQANAIYAELKSKDDEIAKLKNRATEVASRLSRMDEDSSDFMTADGFLSCDYLGGNVFSTVRDAIATLSK